MRSGAIRVHDLQLSPPVDVYDKGDLGSVRRPRREVVPPVSLGELAVVAAIGVCDEDARLTRSSDPHDPSPIGRPRRLPRHPTRHERPRAGAVGAHNPDPIPGPVSGTIMRGVVPVANTTAVGEPREELIIGVKGVAERAERRRVQYRLMRGCMIPVPSEFMTFTSRDWKSSAPTPKATFEPSGEKAKSTPIPTEWVRRRRPLPSGCTLCRSPP